MMEMFTDKSNNTLHVEVTNIPQFNNLLQQARKETEQLSQTLGKLSCFTLDFKFSTDKIRED